MPNDDFDDFLFAHDTLLYLLTHTQTR
jgi:hypothetical protein